MLQGLPLDTPVSFEVEELREGGGYGWSEGATVTLWVGARVTDAMGVAHFLVPSIVADNWTTISKPGYCLYHHFSEGRAIVPNEVEHVTLEWAGLHPAGYCAVAP